MGYEPTRAASIAEADARLAAESFDVLLTDHNLPDGEGASLLRRRPDLPGVLLTGFSTADLPPDLLGPSQAVICTKPVDFDSLGAAINEARRIQHDQHRSPHG